MKATNRIHWLDYLKAFGIFLVVYGHSKSTEWGIEKWIYSFHMPLFFLISGYLMSDKSLSMKTGDFIKKTQYSLLPPYLLFSAIGFLFWFFASRHFGEDANQNISVYNPLLAIIYGTGTAEYIKLTPVVLWFLPCLFVSQVISHTILRAKEIYAFILSILLFIIGLQFDQSIALPLELETALIAQFFIFLGISARRKNITTYFNTKFTFLGFLTLLTIGTTSAFLNHRVDMRSSYFGNPLLFLVSSLSLSLAFAVVFHRMPASKFVSQIAKNTIIIFPLHPLIFSIFNAIYVFILHLNLNIRENPFVGLFASILITLALAFSSPIVKKITPWAYGLEPNKVSNKTTTSQRTE